MIRSARVLIVAAALLLGACTTLIPPPAIGPSNVAATEAAWARVLQRFVNARGEVDFVELARDRGDLDAVVAYVAATALESIPEGAPRLAHHINAYNALSMFNVIDSGQPATHAGFAKLRFFVLRRFVIGGRAMSLYGYENDVIRRLGEARVHFALNCMARSCPVLPRQPFGAATLDADLTREALAFFARPDNLRVDHGARVVWLNEVMRFYTEDFTPAAAPSLLDYVARYTGELLPRDYKVRFTPYDWRVVHVTPR